MSSSSHSSSPGGSSLIATARDRRNRRIAAFKRGGSSRSSSPPATARRVETPPASPLSVSNDRDQSLESHSNHSITNTTTTTTRPPMVVMSKRSWDVDDAPRPRLSPRLQHAAAAANNANAIDPFASSNNQGNTVPIFPDDLLQPDAASLSKTETANSSNTAPTASSPVRPLFRSTNLAPRWSRSLIPPSKQQPSPRQLSGNLAHGQYATSSAVSSGIGTSNVNEPVSSKTTVTLTSKQQQQHRRSLSDSADETSTLQKVDYHHDHDNDSDHPWRPNHGAMLARMTLALQQENPEPPSGMSTQEQHLWEALMSVVHKAQQRHGMNGTPIADGSVTNATSGQEKESTSRRRGKIVELTSLGCEVIDHRAESPSSASDDYHFAAIQRTDSQDTTKSTSHASHDGADPSSSFSRMAKELEEKSLALENAKMIITSLEQASGSLANDLRGKLKAKDDAMAALTIEATDKQKRLDSLAMQLRDLQRNIPLTTQLSHLSHVNKQPRHVDEDGSRLQLTARLEQNLSDLRAQACVIESTGGGDAVAMENISRVLADSISAIKSGLHGCLPGTTIAEGSFFDTDWAQGDASSDGRGRQSQSAMPSDPRRLHRELEEKTRQLQRMEEALKQQRKENQRLQAERSNRRYNDSEIDSMRQEVLSLREQCQTNMELLAKKERELAVLRDSLKVDDEEVGYISDDASEGSEPEEDGIAPSVSSTSLALTAYGPSQAEALATLIAHGGGQLGGDAQAMAKEMRQLHDELNRARTEAALFQKQCRVETESLANAKMIISSLEKANKSMLEDLRSRLQDCNTAIASLLEKSMESEKTISSLRQELDDLRDEKQREAEHYQLQINRIRASSDATFASGPRPRIYNDYKVSVAMETID